MRQVVSAEKGDGDTGFLPVPPPLENDADYVIETWLAHRIHHTYPETGGYNDQSDSLMRDWKTLNLWYLRVSIGYMLHDPNNAAPPFPDVRTMMHG